MTRQTRLRVTLGLNLVIIAVQVVAAGASHSVGLLADAAHNLTDVAAITLSLVALHWARRSPTSAKSFGYHRAKVLAAQANAATLVAVTSLLGFEAVRRLLDPLVVRGSLVAGVAALAFAGNLLAVVVLRERHPDLNMRAATLHMASDALISFGVALAGVVMLLRNGWYWLDPAVSLAVGLLIAREALRLVAESTNVLLQATPKDLDMADLEATMTAVAGVEHVHDLHVWALSEDMVVLSAHVLVAGHPTLEQAQQVGVEVKRAVSGPYGVVHATLELECEGCVDDGTWCILSDDDFRADGDHDGHQHGHHHGHR